MTVRKLMVAVGADLKDFQTKMGMMQKDLTKISKQAEKSIGPVMDKIGTAMKLMGATAGAGFAAAITGSVKGAASLEAYRNTLNVVMKDQEAAGRMMAWAVDFANRTPFETSSVVEATVRLQAYGLEAQKVLPAIGDMAGVMNKDVMQAVEAVADAQTGELERLKEFGITKAMIVEQGNKIMRGVELVNNKGQITDQENFNKTLFNLMQERFQGGMEIQANSFTGLWSTVKGVFSTTFATMAGISAEGQVKIGGFFDNLKRKMQTIIDKLSEWQQNGQLQEWADRAQSALVKFWDFGEKVFNGLIAAGKWIIDRWGMIEPILAGVLAGFLAYKTAITVIDTLKLSMAALNLVMAVNPIGLAVLAVGGLTAAGLALYNRMSDVRTKTNDVWDAQNQLVQSSDGVAESFRGGADAFKWNTDELHKNTQAVNSAINARKALAMSEALMELRKAEASFNNFQADAARRAAMGMEMLPAEYMRKLHDLGNGLKQARDHFATVQNDILGLNTQAAAAAAAQQAAAKQAAAAAAAKQAAAAAAAAAAQQAAAADKIKEVLQPLSWQEFGLKQFEQQWQITQSRYSSTTAEAQRLADEHQYLNDKLFIVNESLAQAQRNLKYTTENFAANSREVQDASLALGDYRVQQADLESQLRNNALAIKDNEKAIKAQTEASRLSALGISSITDKISDQTRAVSAHVLKVAEWLNRVAGFGKQSAGIAEMLSSGDRDQVKTAAMVISMQGQLGSTGKNYEELSNVDISNWAAVPLKNIPKFHSGGTFNAPTPGGQGLAMLRDQERVIAPGQSDRSVHIENNFYGIKDAEEAGRAVDRRIRQLAVEGIL